VRKSAAQGFAARKKKEQGGEENDDLPDAGVSNAEHRPDEAAVIDRY
jgi:hypothetical protein